jgi:nucleotide-binding universal stress UspA family protein
MGGVLAAIDFSPLTDTVLRTAMRLAQALHSELFLVHVAAPEPDFVGYEAGPQSVRDAVADELRREHRDLQSLAERLEDSGVSVTPLLVQGPAGEKLLEESRRLGVELIVMGRRGHGRLHEFFAGSVSREVVRGAPCAVVLVPA